MASLRSFVRRLLGRGDGPRSGVAYWERRAEGRGVRAVLHVGHGADEVEGVTKAQEAILYPMLGAELRGDERTVLDFGCGPGRFTPGLARLVRGRVIGVDPISRFLEMAPRPSDAEVEYRLSAPGRIPLADGEADVAWICLVLGTVVDDEELRRTTAEIERVVRPGGLVFVIENTSPKADVPHYRFRSAAAYSDAFPTATLRNVGEYEDLGERIEVLAGRTATARTP